MKSKLKMIRNIVFFVGLYGIVQLVAVAGYGAFYGAFHSDLVSTLSKEELIEKINESATQNMSSILLIAAVITLIIYYLVLRKKENTLVSRCNFKKVSLNNILKIIIASIGISLFSAVLTSVLYDKFPSYQSVQMTVNSGKSSFLGILTFVVFIPIFEEILFRGLVFRELRNNLNIILSIILQAVIFGAFHMNMLQAIYVFFFAIVLGFVYYWTNSIWSSIVCHIVYNLLGISGFINILAQYINLYVIGLSGVILTVVIMISMHKSYEKNKNIYIVK